MFNNLSLEDRVNEVEDIRTAWSSLESEPVYKDLYIAFNKYFQSLFKFMLIPLNEFQSYVESLQSVDFAKTAEWLQAYDDAFLEYTNEQSTYLRQIYRAYDSIKDGELKEQAFYIVWFLLQGLLPQTLMDVNDQVIALNEKALQYDPQINLLPQDFDYIKLSLLYYSLTVEDGQSNLLQLPISVEYLPDEYRAYLNNSGDSVLLQRNDFVNIINKIADLQCYTQLSQILNTINATLHNNYEFTRGRNSFNTGTSFLEVKFYDAMKLIILHKRLDYSKTSDLYFNTLVQFSDYLIYTYPEIVEEFSVFSEFNHLIYSIKDWKNWKAPEIALKSADYYDTVDYKLLKVNPQGIELKTRKLQKGQSTNLCDSSQSILPSLTDIIEKPYNLLFLQSLHSLTDLYKEIHNLQDWLCNPTILTPNIVYNYSLSRQLFSLSDNPNSEVKKVAISDIFNEIYSIINIISPDSLTIFDNTSTHSTFNIPQDSETFIPLPVDMLYTLALPYIDIFSSREIHDLALNEDLLQLIANLKEKDFIKENAEYVHKEIKVLLQSTLDYYRQLKECNPSIFATFATTSAISLNIKDLIAKFLHTEILSVQYASNNSAAELIQIILFDILDKQGMLRDQSSHVLIIPQEKSEEIEIKVATFESISQIIIAAYIRIKLFIDSYLKSTDSIKYSNSSASSNSSDSSGINTVSKLSLN